MVMVRLVLRAVCLSVYETGALYCTLIRLNKLSYFFLCDGVKIDTGRGAVK